MVDRYHKGGYALPVPVGTECGDVCEKEKKFRELIFDQADKPAAERKFRRFFILRCFAVVIL